MKALGVRSRFRCFLLLLALLFCVFIILIETRTASDNLPPPQQNALYRDETQELDVRVADLLSHMTLEEKIGQMALVEKDSLSDVNDIATYHLGGLLSGSGSKPLENTASGWKTMIDHYQATATATRLGIPLLYGSDAIHGHAHVPEMTVFPHMIALGATNNPTLVHDVAQATALDIEKTGVNWSFSPNLDQPHDIRWGRTYEAFSDDPTLVSKLGVAYLEGMQRGTGMDDESIAVLATPKHYLGLGDMGWGTSLNSNFTIDQGVTPANEQLLREVYLPPFKDAVDAGALSIMAGLNTWGDKRMVLQKYLLTDVLKNELGFTGFVVSDWYGVHEGRKNDFLATIQAINAGVDMVMLPFDYKSFVRDMRWANKLGLISDERIDDAVRRILNAKFALGLFDTSTNSTASNTTQKLSHKTLARDAVAQSLVLLKNEDSLLPLSPRTQHIRVAGSSANNIGRQMGAWTIEWQGVDGNWPLGATSILQGIQESVSKSTRVEYDLYGEFNGKEKADIGIAIVGERPYAEGWGDTAYPILSEDDLTAVKNLQASCDEVLVVIVSGRPLLIKEEIDDLDALVMAWLPGSEGAGVADVLFGNKPFTGTLPLPWPDHSEQLPLTVDGTTQDGTPLLFPRYFGITD